MVQFPDGTAIHRKMSKEAFYRHLPLKSAVKDKFVSDIESIYVENSLSNESLNLETESEIHEILLLRLNLKKPECDVKIMEAIARQNPHKLVFLLVYHNQQQLAIYYKKLYRTPWEDDVTLTAQGFTLDEIWNRLIVQIALRDERGTPLDTMSIDERLSRQEKILKLDKQITRIEAAAWREKQSKKRFELYQTIQRRRTELRGIIKDSQGN